MKNFFVSRAYTIPSCRDRKHSGKNGMVTGLICSIALSVSLLAKPQDSPSKERFDCPKTDHELRKP